MIKALIFDLDNTLIDRQKAFKEMLYRKFRSLYKDEKLVDKMVEDVLLWDNNGTVSRLEVFKMWQKKYNVTVIEPETLDKEWSKESGSVVFLYDDVIDTLLQLKKKYKLALLSNGNSSSQRRKINSTGISYLFDYTLVSGEYNVSKPAKEIYEYTCSQLGCLPEECVYIGDNYNIDYLGSKNAGLTAIYLDRSKKKDRSSDIIHEIKNLLELF